ncbi:hypothetical protein FR483_n370R [Paramecium bursaria Chlorella virus FR483]|uniref:Uncharacterized protein n370R n=1 Tax=Paramecium bursaria Chlorella virus FR483 TaxID=399781 RepID=A7J774_PBCVF|nr:hypothetical protein FR483_n370R [Paramecium bursaria Chlorella virus FR483]ABT15655.1 hypothetical protein FR483_n370R [Paramecium bursaria Chlorella virus FR483]
MRQISRLIAHQPHYPISIHIPILITPLRKTNTRRQHIRHALSECPRALGRVHTVIHRSCPILLHHGLCENLLGIANLGKRRLVFPGC